MNYLSSKLLAASFILFSTVSLFLIVFSANAIAAQWQVVPISLDLSPKVKSGVITIKNTGDEVLQVSVVAKKWLQDQTGKDQFEDTSNLIFFPKVLQVKPNSERVIRVGVKAPAIKQEQTYRLYIKEAVPPSKRSSQVAVALQFGAPIFIQPLEESIVGEINDIQISNGKINFSVQNLGNTHFRTKRVEVIGKDGSGQQVFDQELKGWYVLAGATQYHEAVIPLEILSLLTEIDIRVISDRMELFKAVSYNGAEKVPPQPE